MSELTRIAPYVTPYILLWGYILLVVVPGMKKSDQYINL